MPAAAARWRPAASARFEMTTASVAASRFSVIASISAWRLLPRPEISTPMRLGGENAAWESESPSRDSPLVRRDGSGITHTLTTGANFANPSCACFSTGREQIQHPTFVGRGADDDQTYTHV